MLSFKKRKYSVSASACNAIQRSLKIEANTQWIFQRYGSLFFYVLLSFFLKKKCVQERAKHQADFVLLLGSFSLAKDMFSWIFRLKCRSHDKTIYNSINDNWLLETVEKKKPFSLACNLNSIFFPLFVILHSMASFCRLNFSFFSILKKKINYIIIKEKFGFWNSHSSTRYIKENVNSF